MAVAHRQFQSMPLAEIRSWGKPGHIIYDIKSVLPADAVDARL
jgi:UDP-N-acetyl-D-galactosamine dehydrogenase